jgi:MFS family permease
MDCKRPQTEAGCIVEEVGVLGPRNGEAVRAGYNGVMQKPHVPASHGRQAAIVLVGSVAITLAMFLIPSPERTWWLLAPFRWLHIYVHEFGHGIAALISGGKFDSFEMYTYSGVAHVWTSGALASAFVSAGGLCGPAVVGGVFLAMGRNVRWARYALGAFGAFMAVSLIVWTRTPFGWGFGGAVAALSLLVAFKAKPALAQMVLVFLGVQLALSVYTGGGYLFVRSAEIQNGYRGPSDTQAMADALGLPYWFWGGACAAFSVIVLLAGLWIYVKPQRARIKPVGHGRLAA